MWDSNRYQLFMLCWSPAHGLMTAPCSPRVRYLKVTIHRNVFFVWVKVKFVKFAEYIPELWYKSKKKLFNLQMLLKLFYFFFQRTYFTWFSDIKKPELLVRASFVSLYVLYNYTNRKPLDESSPLPKNLFVVFVVIFIENLRVLYKYSKLLEKTKFF